MTPDAAFSDPRLAEIYDPLDPDRSDLNPYLEIAEELEARSAVDIGCGTGTLACLLALRGLSVTGVDPAAASLEVAARKPGAASVRWVLGDTRDASARGATMVDLVTMTGNVAQVFVSDQQWHDTLVVVHAVLKPGGMLVFETRDPAKDEWRRWTREETERRVEVPGIDIVHTWYELAAVEPPLVSFRGTYVFEDEGLTLTSDSTLRFRGLEEVTASLHQAGFEVEEVRDAPDRPGLELVFLARPVAG